MKLSQKLFEKGILVQGIRPPAVPDNLCRLRVTVMANHTKGDLELALDILKRCRVA